MYNSETSRRNTAPPPRSPDKTAKKRRENTLGLSKNWRCPENGIFMLFELEKSGSKPLEFGVVVIFPNF
jgi:hypothetical protein